MAVQKKKSKKKTIKPGKDIVASMAGDLREKLLKLVDQGINDLVVDLNGVEMVDSVGLGLFIAAHNSMENIGGKFKIVNASKDIFDLMHMMKLGEHFGISMDSR